MGLSQLAPRRAQETAYERHRDYVLGVLARRCGWLDPGEREAALHDAYVVLLDKQRLGTLDPESMDSHQVRAYLVQTAIHKALDEGKRAERKRSEPIGERTLAEPDPGEAPEELAAASLDHARMREIVAALPERRQTIVKLRFFFERTPKEIQNYLGITERTYRRDLERAMRHISERYELVRRGRYCESRRDMILALVADEAEADEAEQARRHLASCPGCARWVAELRAAAQRAAALLPLPPMALDRAPLQALSESLEGVRQGVTDAFAAAKQQLAALVLRVDPSAAGYAAGARPGSVVAAALGCVAVGGGATYCAVEGLPDVLRPSFLTRSADRERREEPAQARHPEIAPSTPVVAAPGQANQKAAEPEPRDARPAKQTRPESEPEPSAPTPQEFDLEASPAPAPPAPPPPPPQPPGEFDP